MILLQVASGYTLTVICVVCLVSVRPLKGWVTLKLKFDTHTNLAWSPQGGTWPFPESWAMDDLKKPCLWLALGTQLTDFQLWGA